MDLGRLRTGDRVLGASAVALAVVAFFPWFGVTVPGAFTAREGGFGNPFSTVGILLAMVLLVVVALRATPRALPELRVRWDRIVSVVAAVSALLLLLQLLVGGGEVTAFGATADLEREIGVWLGALCGLGLVAGALLNERE